MKIDIRKAYEKSSHCAPTRNCFYCGTFVGMTGNVVMWCGNDEKSQEIWLHERCATWLGSELIKDAAR